MFIPYRHLLATITNAPRDRPARLANVLYNLLVSPHFTRGPRLSAIPGVSSPFRASPVARLARTLPAGDMLSAGPSSRKLNSSLLHKQLEEEVVHWTGPSSFSPFVRRQSPEPITPHKIRKARRVRSSPDLKGSAASPISLSSSSPSPLVRPRATPSYTSPLPRTAFTPTKLPLHPFFGSHRAKTLPLPPPSPSRARLAYAFSSSSSSSSACSSPNFSPARNNFPQSPQTTFDPQKDLADMLSEVSLNSPRRAAGSTKAHAGITKLGPTIKAPIANGSRGRPMVKAKEVNSKTAAMLVAALHTSTTPGTDLPVFSHSTFVPHGAVSHRPPTIVYTRSAEEADDFITCLKGDVFGFDLEWPVSGFHRPAGSAKNAKKVAVGGTWVPQAAGAKGHWKFEEQRTALVQICDEKMVILIHLKDMTELPPGVKKLVADRTTYKTGVQVGGDGKKLVRDFTLLNEEPKGLLELSWIARKVDPLVTGPGAALISLANLSKMYLGHDLDKGSVRISDWSKELSQAQREYAANDVYASLQIYLRLKQLATERGIELDYDALSTHLGSHIKSKSPTRERQYGPPRTQKQAYDLFVEGKQFSEIAAEMGIKENTAHGYVLNIGRDWPVDDFSIEVQTRLVNEVPYNSYARTSHKAFLLGLAKATKRTLVSSEPSSPSSSAGSL